MNSTDQNKVKYSSGKSYQWSPEDVFDIQGDTFDATYNALAAYVQSLTPEQVMAVKMVKAFEAMQARFIKGVEDGIIKEVQTTKTVSMPSPIRESESVH